MTSVSPAAQKALASHQRESIKQTRAKLELALRRLIDRKPKIVKKGTRVSALSVCAEARVDRATLYRFHEPVLVEIRRFNETTPREQLKEKRSDLARTQAKLKEYRQLAEQAQSETAALARVNYNLQARVAELEELLRNRDLVIRKYQAESNGKP